jgi:hypothetical protein
VISSWKDIPLLSQNIVARCRIQWVISGWKSWLEGSKKGRTFDKVGCHTDATNPRVRWGFIGYRNLQMAGKKVGTYGGKKWWEQMVQKMVGKLRGKINLALIKIHRSCMQ